MIQSVKGAAEQGSWSFNANHGPLPNPVGHSFPILTYDSNNKWQLIGTGFYISQDGLFLTAKHVIETVLQGINQIKPIVIFHLHSETGIFGPDSYLLRPIFQCWLSKRSDVAFGVAATATNKTTGEQLSHWHWPISFEIPGINSQIGLYAFSNHAVSEENDRQKITFLPDAYLGHIEDIADFRDGSTIYYPYIQSDIIGYKAASGGPTFSEKGFVIGVDTRGMEPDGPEYAAQARCIQDAFIEDVILENEKKTRTITFPEFVCRGIVSVEGYTERQIDIESGVTIKLNRIPINAKGPILEVIEYM